MAKGKGAVGGLEETPARLAAAEAEAERRGRELKALTSGARAVLTQQSFAATARTIFDHCRELTGAASGYVALLSDDGAENELLFLEAGGLPCDVNPELPMPIRGLRAVAYRENRAVYDNDFMQSPWVRYMPRGHVVLRNVLFAPLVIEGRTVGIIGLANKDGDFDDQDAALAASFGELAAVALRNSRDIEARDRAEAERERLIAELQEALRTVRRLGGLLPICSHCKRIRDDQGYWKQVEAFISTHSDARFSHGICPECAERHYPGMNLYDEE